MLPSRASWARRKTTDRSFAQVNHATPATDNVAMSISEKAFSVWLDAGNLAFGIGQADPITPETWPEERDAMIEKIQSWRKTMREIAILAGGNDYVRQRDFGFPEGTNDACFSDPRDWPR